MRRDIPGEDENASGPHGGEEPAELRHQSDEGRGRREGVRSPILSMAVRLYAPELAKISALSGSPAAQFLEGDPLIFVLHQVFILGINVFRFALLITFYDFYCFHFAPANPFSRVHSL